MNEGVPIHMWQGSEAKVTVFRKISMYGQEPICTIVYGDGNYQTHSSATPVPVAVLANAVCEYLESKRGEGASP